MKYLLFVSETMEVILYQYSRFCYDFIYIFSIDLEQIYFFPVFTLFLLLKKTLQEVKP